jgi:serine/threonine protein kinase
MTGIADYEFLDPLGRGNHGRFFLARTPERLGLGGEQCAVKVLDRNVTDQEFRRVASELRVFVALRSECLADPFEVGYQHGALYIAMSQYPDGSLFSPPARLDPAAIAGIVADAARGAHALHEVGVVHRAIKPANILLAGDSGRLSDLGLGQVIAPGLTSTGLGSIGTVEFMEPDIIWGEAAARASDIWSLGITLHRVLVGESVYGEIPEGDSARAFQHVLHTAPELHDGLPATMRTVIQRCTADRRSDRFATAEELADALDRAGARV